MITAFINLQTFNKNGEKSVSVRAVEDSAGGTEAITFVIIDQTKTVSVNFAANTSQTVSVTHTASGVGLVNVTAANSPQTIQRMRDVDKPSDP